MSGVSAHDPESVPNCPRCDRPMVLRTARKGANTGSEFWGCTEFPRCSGTLKIQPPAEAPNDAEPPLLVQQTQGSVGEATGTDTVDKPQGFVNKMLRGVDKGRRWYLESDEPDATGRWDDSHRRRMLRYVYERDGRRCGLCAGEMKLKGAQIEHIVPKVFALFDVGKDGKAKPGSTYKSRQHKIDNLQAAHTYCNKRKGNKPEIAGWRHPAMPPLTVADTQDGTGLVLPGKPVT